MPSASKGGDRPRRDHSAAASSRGAQFSPKTNPRPGELTAEQEASLAARIRAGDALALESLVMSARAVARAIAREHASPGGMPLDDLQSEAMAGLVEAARRFDPTQGRFATYAHNWAHKAVHKAIGDWGLVRVSRRGAEVGRRHERGGLEGLPTVTKDVAIKSRIRRDASATAHAALLGKLAPDPGAEAEEEDERIRRLDMLRAAMAGLTPVEAEIVTRSFGLGVEEESLSSMAIAAGVARETLSRGRSRALAKLRRLVEAKA